jgi:hypothetical protein
MYIGFQEKNLRKPPKTVKDRRKLAKISKKWQKSPATGPVRPTCGAADGADVVPEHARVAALVTA